MIQQLVIVAGPLDAVLHELSGFTLSLGEMLEKHRDEERRGAHVDRHDRPTPRGHRRPDRQPRPWAANKLAVCIRICMIAPRADVTLNDLDAGATIKNCGDCKINLFRYRTES